MPDMQTAMKESGLKARTVTVSLANNSALPVLRTVLGDETNVKARMYKLPDHTLVIELYNDEGIPFNAALVLDTRGTWAVRVDVDP